MPRPEPTLGCSPDELDTPFLYLDLDKFEANIRAMVEACQAYGVEWRPHAKCHKSPEMAHILLQGGAIGMTCAKLSEAEVMAQGGVRDILIANLIAGPRKWGRVAQLCSMADPILAVDHIDHLGPLQSALDEAQQTIRVVLEIDLGMERVGVAAGAPAVALARAVMQHPRLELAGIMGYEGHLLLVPDRQEKHERIQAALDRLAATRDALLDAQLPCDIVSCGGTGSYVHTLQHPVVTELQAGGAIFMDVYYRQRCGVEGLEHALTMVSTVVSRPTPQRAVVDAGRKSLNCEFEMPRPVRSDLTMPRLSAEHGILELSEGARDLRIGDRLQLLPGYADLTINLHDHIFGFRNNRLERIFRVAGRGHVW